MFQVPLSPKSTSSSTKEIYGLKSSIKVEAKHKVLLSAPESKTQYIYVFLSKNYNF